MICLKVSYGCNFKYTDLSWLCSDGDGLCVLVRGIY